MKFTNNTGSTVTFPYLGEGGGELRVPDGGTFEATGPDAKNLEAAGFERVDKSKSSEKE